MHYLENELAPHTACREQVQDTAQQAGADRRRTGLTQTSGKSQRYLWERRLP